MCRQNITSKRRLSHSIIAPRQQTAPGIFPHYSVIPANTTNSRAITWVHEVEEALPQAPTIKQDKDEAHERERRHLHKRMGLTWP
jgi:hypothetical protein